MSGTQYFPSITAEPETSDPTRRPRLRSIAAIATVIAAGAAAGWWWTADLIGALVAAVCLVVLTCAVIIVPLVVARLDAFDRRLTEHDRDLARHALEVGVVRNRQDTDHATVSVLGQRIEEQHLALGEYRSEQRNNVLDMRAKTRRTP